MLRIVTLLLSVVVTTVSMAANPPPMPKELADYEEYGIFTYYPSVPEALFLEGESIPPNHGLELRKALNELSKVTTLVLDSPGGSVYSALNMAGVIHDRSLKTYIPTDGNCASACSFLFLAGTDRFANGKLGVHQFAPVEDRKENRSKTIAQAQFTMSDLYAVLSQFDVPNFVIVKMFETPADEMYYFTSRQLRTINKGVEPAILNKVDELLHIRDTFLVELASHIDKSKKVDQPAPTPVIKIDPLLAEIQDLLNKHGCDAGTTDGLMGAMTLNALKRFAIATDQDPQIFSKELNRISQKDALRKVPFSACNDAENDKETPAVTAIKNLDHLVKLERSEINTLKKEISKMESEGGASVRTRPPQDLKNAYDQIERRFENFESMVRDLFLLKLRSLQKNYSDLSVTFTIYNGQALLTGQVPDLDTKNNVAYIAATTEGIIRIHDELKVSDVLPPVRQNIDRKMEIYIGVLILENGLPENVIVRVEDGEVWLMGRVTREQADKLVDITRHVTGVQRIIKVFEYITESECRWNECARKYLKRNTVGP